MGLIADESGSFNRIWFRHTPRNALKTLQEEGPIQVEESLPFGSDTMETFVMPENDMNSLAERINADQVEEPSMEPSDPEATSVNFSANDFLSFHVSGSLSRDVLRFSYVGKIKYPESLRII